MSTFRKKGIPQTCENINQEATRSIFCKLYKVVGGIATWRTVRAGMWLLEEEGELTAEGIRKVEMAALAALGSAPLGDADEEDGSAELD